MAAIKVNRKKNESSDQLLTRFNRRSTRFVKSLRNGRFLDEKSSALKKKRGAIIREKYRAEAERKKHYE
ncbi:MAG: hypothetical protein K9L85_00685 [Candidatus Peribacteraceae bacterium]|nr:hypothetical protein [Candidatus Peribacteraceae bacterium]